MDKQKQTEIADLKAFLTSAKINFQDLIPDEKPDFSIIVDKNKIGIELTEYDPSDKYSQDIRSVLNTYESIKVELVSELQKITTENITFNFSIRKPIIKRIKKAQKDAIISFFLEHLNLPDIKSVLSDDVFHKEFIYEPDQNEFIEIVRISKSQKNNSIYASINDMYWSGHIPESKIQLIIDKKEKLVDFKKNEQNWLLIILPEKEYSDGAFLSETVENQFFSRFNKTFIYTKLQREVFELKLASR